MSVLVLNRNPLGPFPYNRWLSGYEGHIVVIAPRDRIELMGEQVPLDNLGYKHLEILSSFDDEKHLVNVATELAHAYGVRYVLTHRDADLSIAARLRQDLGLDGPWPEDVLAFRDKAVMKARARAAGIPVAEHVVPLGPEDVGRFAADQGYPIVLKRRDGYNSIGQQIIHDEPALRRALKAMEGSTDWLAYLVEAFVPGKMCHVDGLVLDGRTVLAWPSQYQYSLSSYATDRGPRIDLTLGPDDPLTGRLLEFTLRVLAALRPAVRMPHHAFHAEIFHTPHDQLVLCEIAARPGGAKVREVIGGLFDVDLAEAVSRATVGLPVPVLESVRRGEPLPKPKCMGGQVLLMKRPGLVRSLPALPQHDWLTSFSYFVKVGQRMAGATGSADFMVGAVGMAANRAECESRLRALGEYLASSIEVEEAPVQTGAPGN
ncbi:MAG TPA: hypothetical protein VFN61_05955 [Acidimicrobiales bacterium]|nr:hypothetical protein [Acidimicrobiales bacterium]